MLTEQIDDKRLLVRAPAKVNLFLEILNRRSDGYHNINSLFQAVSLFDDLIFEATDVPGVQIIAPGAANLPLDHTNLIACAYQELCEKFDLQSGLLDYLKTPR